MPEQVSKAPPPVQNKIIPKKPIQNYDCKYPAASKRAAQSVDDKSKTCKPNLQHKPAIKTVTRPSLSASNKPKTTLSTAILSKSVKPINKLETMSKKENNNDIDDLKTQLNQQSSEIRELKEMLEKLSLNKGKNETLQVYS